jgi:hypothetical protein
MADPDQMSRDELLAAKERVEQQLERLRYRPAFLFPSVWMGSRTRKRGHRSDLIAELNQILDQINYELEHPGA